ncbi:MAG: SH3 domain-containing protein [Alphaproteobacteria bacterium]
MAATMRSLKFLPVLCLAISLLAIPAAFAVAPSETENTDKGESGLPIPRFVSLRADEVNLRTGPGVRYPVDWVVQRRGLPVEVVAEFEAWRKIRDQEGVEGWVNKAMLSGRRTILVTGDIRTIRRNRSADAPAVARVEPGVVARLVKCDESWCKVEVDSYEGWLQRDELWGLYPNEKVE